MRDQRAEPNTGAGRGGPGPSSVVAFLALVGVAATGASFADKGQAGASTSMAVLTGVVLLCRVVNVLASRSLRRASGTKAWRSRGPAVMA